MLKNETHPSAPSLTKRRSDEVPLFLREGFRSPWRLAVAR